ncbi:ABC transporter permease [Cellulomonas edaphi]|uniref:FtsX-like permease family protein n=1 Tax=Cellulomonas edaphi TaxID=3053468 RepID=A0ABT7S824_9CELL|nr:FtsX-like permease family protein [Cellulomons edaphi]MDM7831783.1 FtsX-like permease family protein [Cellulomons edaphi]
MLRLTLAQMRRSLGRLVAAGIAIAIGTAFVTATLLAGDVFSRATDDALTARYGAADLVVAGPVTPESLAAVQHTPGVQAASPLLLGSAQVSVGTRSEYLALLAQSPVPAFDTLRVTDGSLAGAGEIALPESTAKRLGVAVGDQVDVTTYSDTDPDAAPVVEKVTVSGLVDDPKGAWTEYGGAGSAAGADLQRWNGGPVDSTSILVRTDDVQATQAALVATVDGGAEVWTKQQAASHAVSELSDDGTDFVLLLVLGFGGVALVVAGLVISNTFQVLVAQRTRTLALLRCVGARRSQLRTSVLVEAGIVGLGASAVGVLSGAALGQITLWALDGTSAGPKLPSTIALSAVTVLLPLVVGTLVTLASCLVPARAATRVSPVAALRPVEAPSVRSRAGTVRLTLSLVMAIGGFLGLALSIGAAHLSPLLGLGLGLLSGAVSFVGVLLGAVYWVPRVVGVVGGAFRRTGATARLAAANSVRNPRRTAATSTALLIGVTLVALMSTGAASARASLSGALDEQYPVDMMLSRTTAPGEDDQGFQDGLAAVRAVPGVADVVELTTVTAQSDDGSTTWELLGVDPEQAHGVLRNDDIADQLRDGVVLTSSSALGDAVKAGGTNLTVVKTGGLGGTSLVTADVASSIDPSAPTTTAWVRLASGTDAGDVLDEVRQVVGSDIFVESAGAEREQYERLIDTLLAIVVGLLGVAVLIALIGVANTLSLSVIERRRESATLRAIGLSRRRLRLSLGIEGMLIAGVGALLGVALGLVYGWAGSAIVFGSFGELHLAVPWLDLGLVLAVAVAAGLVASVLPARRAARTSPVAALAVD